MSKNKYTHRKATEKDKSFILELQKNRLSQYNLHKKRLPSSNEDSEYKILTVEEVDILSVWIVLFEEQRIGAWHMQFEEKENFLRIFWLSSVENVRGVGSYIIQEIKTYCEKMRYREARLSVNLKNNDAIKCYINNGFEIDEKYFQEIEMKVAI
jgi:L-amino acid N-acyltransferase YncA